MCTVTINAATLRGFKKGGKTESYHLVSVVLPGETESIQLKIKGNRPAAVEWAQKNTENMLADDFGQPRPWPKLAKASPQLFRVTTKDATGWAVIGNIYPMGDKEGGYITKYGVIKGDYGMMADTDKKFGKSWWMDYTSEGLEGTITFTEREITDETEIGDILNAL